MFYWIKMVSCPKSNVILKTSKPTVMIVIITFLLLDLSIAVSNKHSEIKNQQSNISVLCQKAQLLLSFFDSHKKNFTMINFIPIKTEQLIPPFY